MNCSQTYDLFFNPGEVTEIRAYGLSGKSNAWEGWARGAGIVYGYFDNAADFGRCAEALDKAKAPGIYFTLNPVIPDLLARSANRLKAADAKTSATSDKDIKCIRWIPIDLDPIRPSGISSTDAELKAAILLRNKIWKYMEQQGFSGYIPACSGNGAHLAYRMDDVPLENRDNPSKDPTVLIVRDVLRLLDAVFKNDKVDIDQKVFNASRIWKVYGTVARKGDNTTERPHRRSYIEPKFLKEKKDNE